MSDKSSKAAPADYWPCACVRRDEAGNLSAIKLNSPLVKRCRRCGSKKPPSDKGQ